MKVSLVLRTRDKEELFERVLRMLLLQSVCPSEIIVVDNFSSEERLNVMRESLAGFSEKLEKRRVEFKLASVSDDNFSHSYSTNLGICNAKNEFVCVTNAHSLPCSSFWLENGLKFFENEKVACVSGYFYPYRNSYLAQKLDMITYYLTERYVLNMNWCSTMNCILKKSLWKIYPFDENLPKIIPETKLFGLEDYDWTLEMRSRGFKVVVDSRFSIYHSHEHGWKEVERNIRNFTIHRRIRQKIRRLNRPRQSFTRAKKLEVNHILP